MPHLASRPIMSFIQKLRCTGHRSRNVGRLRAEDLVGKGKASHSLRYCRVYLLVGKY